MLRLPPGYREITSSLTFEVPFASAVTGRAEGTTHRWGEMGIQHSQALSALLPCSRPRDPLFQAEASHPSCLCVLGRAGAEQSHPQGCRAQGTRSMEQHLPAGRRGRTGEQSQILILPARLALVQPWPIGVTPILNQVAQERVVTTLVQAKPYRGKESTSSASRAVPDASGGEVVPLPPFASSLHPLLTFQSEFDSLPAALPAGLGGCHKASQGREESQDQRLQALQLLLPPSPLSPTLQEPQMC